MLYGLDRLLCVLIKKRPTRRPSCRDDRDGSRSYSMRGHRTGRHHKRGRRITWIASPLGMPQCELNARSTVRARCVHLLERDQCKRRHHVARVDGIGERNPAPFALSPRIQTMSESSRTVIEEPSSCILVQRNPLCCSVLEIRPLATLAPAEPLGTDVALHSIGNAHSREQRRVCSERSTRRGVYI